MFTKLYQYQTAFFDSCFLQSHVGFIRAVLKDQDLSYIIVIIISSSSFIKQGLKLSPRFSFVLVANWIVDFSQVHLISTFSTKKKKTFREDFTKSQQKLHNLLF